MPFNPDQHLYRNGMFWETTTAGTIGGMPYVAGEYIQATGDPTREWLRASEVTWVVSNTEPASISDILALGASEDGVLGVAFVVGNPAAGDTAIATGGPFRIVRRDSVNEVYAEAGGVSTPSVEIEATQQTAALVWLDRAAGRLWLSVVVKGEETKTVWADASSLPAQSAVYGISTLQNVAGAVFGILYRQGLDVGEIGISDVEQAGFELLQSRPLTRGMYWRAASSGVTPGGDAFDVDDNVRFDVNNPDDFAVVERPGFGGLGFYADASGRFSVGGVQWDGQRTFSIGDGLEFDNDTGVLTIGSSVDGSEIRSGNYLAPNGASSPFARAGTRMRLDSGCIFSENLVVDCGNNSLFVRGSVVAKALTVETDDITALTVTAEADPVFVSLRNMRLLDRLGGFSHSLQWGENYFRITDGEGESQFISLDGETSMTGQSATVFGTLSAVIESAAEVRLLADDVRLIGDEIDLVSPEMPKGMSGSVEMGVVPAAVLKRDALTNPQTITTAGVIPNGLEVTAFDCRRGGFLLVSVALDVQSNTTGWGVVVAEVRIDNTLQPSQLIVREDTLHPNAGDPAGRLTIAKTWIVAANVDSDVRVRVEVSKTAAGGDVQLNPVHSTIDVLRLG